MKARKETLLIWSAVLVGAVIIFSFTYRDAYLRSYSVVLLIFATWSIFCIKKRIVNVLLIFSAFYAILFAFGPMILYSEGYSYYKEVGNYIILSFLCFAVGYQCGGKLVIHHKPKKLFMPANNSKAVFRISVFIFCIGMAAYSMYFLRSWRSIFIADLENGRVAAMTGNGLLLWLGDLVWLAIYMMFEQNMMNGRYKRATLIMFGIAAVFSILLGFRSALVNPILVLFFMRNKKKEIPLAKMIGLALLLFAFVGIYGAIRSGSGSSLSSLLNEFKVSCVNLNNILGTFPKRVPFQWGKTYLLDFLTLVDDNVEGVTLWLKDVLRLTFSGGGVTPTIIGEFYINWGIVGVVIGMILSGIYFRRVDYAYKNQKNSIFLSCLILGYIRPIIRGGFGNSMVNLLYFTIGYCGCQLIAKKMRRYSKRH